MMLGTALTLVIVTTVIALGVALGILLSHAVLAGVRALLR